MSIRAWRGRVIAVIVGAGAVLVGLLVWLTTPPQAGHVTTGRSDTNSGAMGYVYAAQSGHLADTPGGIGEISKPVAECDLLAVVRLSDGSALFVDTDNGSRGWGAPGAWVADTPATC